MKKITQLCWILLALTSLLLLVVLVNPHTRLYYVDGKLMQAMFIELPGWETAYCPEQIIKPDNWMGSKIEGVEVNINGKRNLEVEALTTLQASGLFADCKLKQQGDHWILYKPAKKRKFFTLEAFYRISCWKPAE